MKATSIIRSAAAMILLCLSFYSLSHDEAKGSSVFEMRTYTTFDGKLTELDTRFRNHTIALFEKHGMQNVGYWIPTDKPNTLIYILAHTSKAAASKSWKAFINDPEWQSAYKASIKDGNLVSNIDSVFMNATDYSAIH